MAIATFSTGQAAAPRESPGASVWRRRLATAPGLGAATLLAVVATNLGRQFPVIGGPVFGIVLGGLIAPLLAQRSRAASLLAPGLTLSSKKVLQLAIIVLGSGLSLAQVATVGRTSLPVMLGSLAVALGGAAIFGRLLRIDRDVRTLVGVGTGICGASAIAATTATIKPRETAVAYAIGTIFTFNIAAVFTFPPVGHLLQLSGTSFGLWAGTAVNDTSSVVATAFSYGHGSEPYAIVVKLVRSLMIVPIVISLSLLRRRAQRRQVDGGEASSIPWSRVVPTFIIGFVAMAGLNSIGLIPASWHPGLATLGAFLITTALCAIGLSLDLREMRRAGVRPLILGGILWALVAASSLLLQHLTGTL